MKVLVTGGTGYIGSHTCIELIAQGHHVVVADNLSNSNPVVLDRLATITGVRPDFYELDACDEAAVDALFHKESFDAVIHFAALKAVGESVAQPLRYFQNNITGLLSVCAAMEHHQVRRLIFSSSATVYGVPDQPVAESADSNRATNPYGATKVVGEQVLSSLAQAQPDWRITLLRYFNPVGAHPSGLIGEDPKGTPNNLVPFVAQVAVGKHPQVMVYGDDYDTVDGTGVRDYIHVSDLAAGHVAALHHEPTAGQPDIYNLGCGKGYSVLEVIKAFEQAAGHAIPFQITDRRPGDVASVVADAVKAEHELGWKATKTLDDMCRDSWRWQSTNPDGFGS